MTTIDIARLDHDTWLSLRKLGSSDAAAICGLNPWCSPYDVFADKIGLLPAQRDNEAMEVGRVLEEPIARLFEKRTGLSVTKCGEMFVHHYHHFMTATPDYWVKEDEVVGILEIKNTSIYGAAAWTDGIPDPAHIQIMHQLACTGAPFAYACALIGGNKLKFQRVERDEGIIGRLEVIEADFWRMVETSTPPPLRADDGETLAKVYARSVIEEIPLPAEAKELVEMYRRSKEKEKSAKSEADYAATQLKAMLEYSDSGTIDDYRVSWKAIHKDEHTVKASDYRMFTVKEIKSATEK